MPEMPTILIRRLTLLVTCLITKHSSRLYHTECQSSLSVMVKPLRFATNPNRLRWSQRCSVSCFGCSAIFLSRRDGWALSATGGYVTKTLVPIRTFGYAFQLTTETPLCERAGQR
jgi:hypothetical protein